MSEDMIRNARLWRIKIELVGVLLAAEQIIKRFTRHGRPCPPRLTVKSDDALLLVDRAWAEDVLELLELMVLGHNGLLAISAILAVRGADFDAVKHLVWILPSIVTELILDLVRDASRCWTRWSRTS